MKDFYERYYQAEASGHVHTPAPQNGRGFFGRVVKSTMQPLVQTLTPYVKEGAIKAGKNILQSLERGESLSQSVQKGIHNSIRCKRGKKKKTGSGLKKNSSRKAKKSKSKKTRKNTNLF